MKKPNKPLNKNCQIFSVCHEKSKLRAYDFLFSLCKSNLKECLLNILK